MDFIGTEQMTAAKANCGEYGESTGGSTNRKGPMEPNPCTVQYVLIEEIAKEQNEMEEKKES